jgi:hypothetical protein
MIPRRLDGRVNFARIATWAFIVSIYVAAGVLAYIAARSW